MKTKLSALLFLAALTLSAQQIMPLGPYGQIPAVPAANTAADTAALTAGQMSTVLVGTPTAAATYTTASAANLCKLFPFVGSANASNWWWFWIVKNTSAGANTITVAGGTGMTLSGTGTAAQNTVRTFIVILTNCTVGSEAGTLLSLNTGAF